MNLKDNNLKTNEKGGKTDDEKKQKETQMKKGKQRKTTDRKRKKKAPRTCLILDYFLHWKIDFWIWQGPRDKKQK